MQLMSIGRFARLTGLGVKALRHYDEIGLLRPAAVDDDTGYRFYGSEQVGAAEEIRRLRRLELPLEEIRALIETRDPAVLRDVLVSHQRRTAARSARLDAVLQRLQAFLDGRETVMGTRAESLDAEAQRRLGVDLFNKTWTLLEKPSRTRDEEDELVHCAHASAYHWAQVGTRANRARSEWQCSRAYAVLGRPEPALHHARRCLELVESAPGDMEDWDLAAAYEALARAHAAAGSSDEARRFRALGLDAIARVDDEEDRAPIEADLASLGV